MSGFEKQILPNGKPNPKYIDVLDEDAPIAGQKWGCFSFISPEKILKQREEFIFEEFLKQWDFKKSMDKFHDFIHFLAFKYKLKADAIVEDYTEFVKEESTKLKQYNVSEDFKAFMEKNEDEVVAKFQKAHEFQTSTRGIKFRGAFGSEEEARMRCKKLQEQDPNHDIFVGPIGIWIPWDPDAYKTGDVQFLNDELNQLYHEKMKNEAKAKEDFENRVKEAKRKAIEENIKAAQKSGNTLTQTIDEQGNLVGVREKVDFESREAATEESTKEYNNSVLERALNSSASSASSAEGATEGASPSSATEDLNSDA